MKNSSVTSYRNMRGLIDKKETRKTCINVDEIELRLTQKKRGGVLVGKLFCSFVNPFTSLLINLTMISRSMKKYGEQIPAVHFQGNGCHLRRYIQCIFT